LIFSLKVSTGAFSLNCGASCTPYEVNIKHKTPRGILIPKQALHENASTKAPPIVGAVIRPRLPTPLRRLFIIACLERGKHCLRSLNKPPFMAPRPRPLIARPRMKIADNGARVQIRAPTSNVAIPIRNIAFVENKV
jgi:hypothetical protein